jgi:polyphosphate kinase
MRAAVLPGPDRFLNRELSWLDFDQRVLTLAADVERPLLARVRFLAIFSRNLDEFFQVRVASLQDQVAAGVGASSSPDGRTPAEQLAAVRARVLELTEQAQKLFAQEIRPALPQAGIELTRWDALTEVERRDASERFESELRPVLVPLSVDPAHPFPYLSGLALNVGALLRRRAGGGSRFARVKVPGLVDRLWNVGGGRFVPVEQVILGHLAGLFPEDEILHAGFFRVTRDAELELRESESVDLVRDIEAGLRRRLRGSDAVRLEVSEDLAPEICELLSRELRLEPDEIYEVPGMLDLGGLAELERLDRPDLKESPWSSQRAPGLPPAAAGPEAFFAALRQHDVLVHHPYESFESSVEGFLQAAADDPAVRVVMCTIYRTGGPETGIVRALERAASRGVQVVVLVELKARFEEASNLERARGLERSGAHVVYGVLGLKTHAKLALVVRQEAELRRYCHVGTGNYNPVTARYYEDLGLLTSAPALGRDVAELFQRLTSGSGGRLYERLLVAPESLRGALLAEIGREAEAGDGRIAIKLNNLSDPGVIDALYTASQAGAEVDLVVRGICCLRPGVPGLSERIRVRSVLGRFLEHSRIFRFGSRGRGRRYWIGSADLMQRNLDLRVETLAPVEAPALRARLEALLELYLDPETRAWQLGPDGVWRPGRGQRDVQERLLAEVLTGA